MLVHQLVTRVQNMTEDTSYWTSDRIIKLINNCIDEISTHFALTVSGFTQLVSAIAQRSYSVPYDFISLSMLYWGDAGNYLTPENRVSPDVVMKQTSNPAETGIPSCYYLWGREDVQEIWVWPTFDAVYTLDMYYWRRPPEVVNLNDEPLLPRDWHASIAEYCRRQIWVEDEVRNYTPERFDSWWDTTLTRLQISQNIQQSSAEQISLGNFTDRMPSVNGGDDGFNFRIGASDGTYGWSR